MDIPDRKCTVVVGVDGSDESRLALEWATDPEKQLGTVCVSTAYSIGPTFDGLGPPPQPIDLEIFRKVAERRAAAVIEAVDPGLLSSHVVAADYAGQMLVEASMTADLLVVGCRGRGGLASALLGSTGSHCVKHAQSAVAIVPSSAGVRGPLRRLVVGIDGSPNSKRALRWALDRVAKDGTVVAASTFASLAYSYSAGRSVESDLHRSTTEEVRQIVASVASHDEAEQLVEIVVVPGDPRSELPKVAQGADALVLGARGTRGVAYLLLGSVATALTHQPSLVTVVLPDVARELG